MDLTKFAHKVEGGTGSNSFENGCHEINRLTAILENLLHTIMTVHAVLVQPLLLALALTICHPLYTVHRFDTLVLSAV